MSSRRVVAALAFALLAACSEQVPPDSGPPVAPSEHSPSYEDAGHVMGQVLYVPIYSHVYQNKEKRPFNLVATLSVRNTDLSEPIQVTSVRYYSSEGHLVHNYVDDPLELVPLASADFVVDEHDEHGSGTGFIVEWIARQEVNEPVVEAVMISVVQSQGLSFTSAGRLIRTIGSH
jgi:hypothetical protein